MKGVIIMLKSSLIASVDAKAGNSQIYIGKDYRVTVLTERLIRFEFSNSRSFTDLPSYAVWFRRFPAVKFSVKEDKKHIVVETPAVKFYILRKNGAPDFAEIIIENKALSFKKSKNLGGTRRTLDRTLGRASVDDGLITDNGVYCLDDGDSLLISENGSFTRRKGEGTDLYLFAYGKDYRETVKAFYKISSPVPIIPRFALGVWWSRYRKYTQQEYQDLMLRFIKENIPLTVATVDMDWHWVDLNDEFGDEFKKLKGKHNKSGWTGYSWNTKLFPDYRAFLRFLKDLNLRVTLNLHPADGVRFFEDMYADFAKAVGVDPESKEDIPFVCGSDKFWNAYFDIIHKPYEREGVDFWWIDWQQGTKSDVKGLDPLKALNHYHYLDNAENGEIPLILSRYGGLGSHRYPLGFSGDTAINWKVLDFQPEFTATAANAAYTWWSHDIGGHCFGERDDELYLRWLQFGVFSPIMRLHSTQDDLLGKEPWMFRTDVYKSAKEYLRLRHAFIPYIYTMDHRTHTEGIALCEPLYYSYPDNENAYKYKNQYMFGSELLVCPITEKADKATGMAMTYAWLPDGRWTDIFTGQSYNGGKCVPLNRDIEFIPVLAREGAFLPLSRDKGNSSDNPENLELLVFSGNGRFVLREDNGKVDFAEHCCDTAFVQTYDSDNNTLSIKICAPDGDLSVIPKNRNLRVTLADICKGAEIGGEELSVDDKDRPYIDICVSSANGEIELNIENAVRKTQDLKERVVYILSRWQEKTIKKNIAYMPFEKARSREDIIKALEHSKLPFAVSSAVKEALETL